MDASLFLIIRTPGIYTCTYIYIDSIYTHLNPCTINLWIGDALSLRPSLLIYVSIIEMMEDRDRDLNQVRRHLFINLVASVFIIYKRSIIFLHFFFFIIQLFRFYWQLVKILV